jgi:hypothetical protein
VQKGKGISTHTTFEQEREVRPLTLHFILSGLFFEQGRTRGCDTRNDTVVVFFYFFWNKGRPHPHVEEMEGHFHNKEQNNVIDNRTNIPSFCQQITRQKRLCYTSCTSIYVERG